MKKDKFLHPKKGKIVLVKGQSQYNVLCLACDLIARGFEENGYQTKVLDGNSFKTIFEFYETIKKEMQDGGLFIFSYNALFHNIKVDDNTGLYDFLGYPVFGFLVDHPCYHHTRLLNTFGDNIHIGSFDRNHIDYIKTYYPKLKNVNFIPHFSFQSEKFIPYENKSIDIYFPGSYKNPSSYNSELENMPKVFADIINVMIVELLKNKNLTLEDALRRYLSSINFEYSNEDFAELMNVVILADMYIRNYYRDRIVRAILSAGIPLVVCGKGWEELKEEYGDTLNVIGCDGLDIEDNVKLISNSRILINIFPQIKNGTHERIFTAMRNGCICFTNNNKFLEDNFKNGESLVFYDIDHIEEIPEKLKWLLSNLNEAKKIAENGYHIACSAYDEKYTARRVLDIMGLE